MENQEKQTDEKYYEYFIEDIDKDGGENYALVIARSEADALIEIHRESYPQIIHRLGEATLPPDCKESFLITKLQKETK
ncbi:MAG: hypothetical protein WC584_02840 [Candidatus Pacearchaeota archaeon]